MLDNYSVGGTSENWVLLNRKSGPLKRETSYLPLGTEAAELGEEVSVPQANGPVFVEVRAKLSGVGKLISLLYKVPPLWIRVTAQDGKQSAYRVNANMMETGFFLSPLVTTNDDFVRLFRPDSPPQAGGRVKSFALAVAGDKSIVWEMAYTATFKQYQY
jgi:hypothetical protein